MLLDSQNLFSDNQKISKASPADSDNIVKFGKGDISYLPLLIQVTNDFTNVESLDVKVVTSADEAFSEPVELASSKLPLNALKCGAIFPITHMPSGNLGYIKLIYTPEGASDETTGCITSGIVSALETDFE